MTNIGWTCTRCLRVYAPHISECPHCQPVNAVGFCDGRCYYTTAGPCAMHRQVHPPNTTIISERSTTI